MPAGKGNHYIRNSCLNILWNLSAFMSGRAHLKRTQEWKLWRRAKKKALKAHYTSLFLLNFLLHHKISVVTSAALFQEQNNQFRMLGAADVVKIKPGLDPLFPSSSEGTFWQIYTRSYLHPPQSTELQQGLWLPEREWIHEIMPLNKCTIKVKESG